MVCRIIDTFVKAMGCNNCFLWAKFVALNLTRNSYDYLLYMFNVLWMKG
jgi:hypothetical protein